MFFVAASLLSFDMKSSMTAHLLLAAHCAASGFFVKFGWPDCALPSVVLANALLNNVEIESMTIRAVPEGGNAGDGWNSKARRWGRVGVVK